MKRQIKLIKIFSKPLKRDQSSSLKVLRKIWSVMKEILGKCTTKSSAFPTKITVNKTDIFDVKKYLMNSINF